MPDTAPLTIVLGDKGAVEVTGVPTLHWLCPGCEQSNATTGWTVTLWACAHCGKQWAECPNDDCYAMGEDCALCGGQSGGLVEVQDPTPQPEPAHA